jgi:hypothetical protein
LQQPEDDDPESSASIRKWLLEVMAQTGLKATPLAKEAGLAPSTLLRALDKEHPGSLEYRSIEKIVQKFGVEPPHLFRPKQQSGLFMGLRVGEHATSTRGDPELQQMAIDAVPELMRSEDQTLWKIRSNVVELFGYLSGDIVVLDGSVQPEPKDIIVARTTAHHERKFDLVIRFYDPPYLISGTFNAKAGRKPLLVDNEQVVIMGVVVKSLRFRRANTISSID